MSYFVDLHCHLDLYPNFQQAIDACERKEVFTIGVTTVPGAWPQNKALTANKKFIRPALGMHPQLANDPNARLDIWDKYFPEAKYIGEIGLDAGPKFYKSIKKQESNFIHIVNRCAAVGGKVLSIHSVRTAKMVLDYIETSGAHRNNKIILHWFSGTVNEAKRAVSLGCFFSVNIQMLQGARIMDLLNVIPIDRLLTESDGPFVQDGIKAIDPGAVETCVSTLSQLLKITPAETRVLIYNNFKRMLQSE